MEARGSSAELSAASDQNFQQQPPPHPPPPTHTLVPGTERSCSMRLALRLHEIRETHGEKVGDSSHLFRLSAN